MVDGGGKPSPSLASRNLLQPPETMTTGLWRGAGASRSPERIAWRLLCCDLLVIEREAARRRRQAFPRKLPLGPPTPTRPWASSAEPSAPLSIATRPTSAVATWQEAGCGQPPRALHRRQRRQAFARQLAGPPTIHAPCSGCPRLWAASGTSGRLESYVPFKPSTQLTAQFELWSCGCNLSFKKCILLLLSKSIE